ncbi:MAG TPA: MFS transporter, partial [Gammaproteobacteria bacterium]|nr:MFS transporter [Gammaproteobacteria bacterium]
FVVALPVYLAVSLGWDHWQVGGFLALWIIGYGVVQTQAPRLTAPTGRTPDGRDALGWALVLSIVPALIAALLWLEVAVQWSLLIGLLVFGVVFAINSSLHSYLIVHYADADGVSLDVGFYYMANAMGRLMGTLLSGWLFQSHGLAVCLLVSSGFVLLAALLSAGLPHHRRLNPAA